MAEAKKTTGKTIIDVTHPGKSAPSGTSKPVLVTNRPILKDPMVVDDEAANGGMPEKEVVEDATKSAAKHNIQPLTPPETEAEKSAEDTKAEATPTPEKAEDKPDDKLAEASKLTRDGDSEQDPSAAEQTAQQLEVEAEQQAKKEAAVQKLVENKQYFLPINAVEKRRTKRVIALGIALSIFLAIAWVDIAIDAGLIEVQGVKPVTHFFSN